MIDPRDAEPWDRQLGEPTKAHAAFRVFRDLPPHQRSVSAAAEAIGGSESRGRAWAQEWDWRARADAWDDACHRIEDQERLDAIRSMHALHRQAGRTAITKAMEALDLLQPKQLTPSMVARLLELGAKLERSTATVSVEELQGIDVTPSDDELDPWQRIADALDTSPHFDTEL